MNDVDDYGNQVQDYESKSVFAELASIGTKEFYQAAAEGFKPELKFILPDIHEYEGQEELIYDGFIYKILRTYKKGQQLEITAYGGVQYVST